MHSILFGKFHGLGNDFVLFDCRAHTPQSATTLQKLLRNRDSTTPYAHKLQISGGVITSTAAESQLSSSTVRKAHHPLPPETVVELCREGLGIGADGVMYALPRHMPHEHYPACSGSLDISSGQWITQCSDVYRPLSNAQEQHVPLQELTMVMNNKDGSIAEMCGNGVRALAYYLFTQDIEHNVVYSFESKTFYPARSGVCYLMHTLAGPKYCYVPPIHPPLNGLSGQDESFPREHVVVVDMGSPSFRPESIPTLLSPNAIIHSPGHSSPALVAVPLPLTLDSVENMPSVHVHGDINASISAHPSSSSSSSPSSSSSSSSSSSPSSSISPLLLSPLAPSQDSSSPSCLPHHTSLTLSPALAALPQRLRREWRATIVNTGVPHAVIFVDGGIGDVDADILSSTPSSSSLDPTIIPFPILSHSSLKMPHTAVSHTEQQDVPQRDRDIATLIEEEVEREGQRWEQELEEGNEEGKAEEGRAAKTKEDLWRLVHEYIGVLGPYFCTHPCFPKGCNINFARIRSDTLEGTDIGTGTGTCMSTDVGNGTTNGGGSAAIVDTNTGTGAVVSEDVNRSMSMDMGMGVNTSSTDTSVKSTNIMIDALVWERGCGVTQACGTGACAIAVAARLEGRVGKNDSRNIIVKLPGGVMSITWKCHSLVTYMPVDANRHVSKTPNECDKNGTGTQTGAEEEKHDKPSEKISPSEKICMTGPATYVFTGNVRL